MSLRKQIVAATIVMVLATVIVSSLVAYFATESRLGVFVEQIGDEEAARLAQSLSRAHAEAGGWQTAAVVLEQAGYAYGATVQRAQTASGEENHIEVLHQDPVRVVIVDAQGSIVLDNFGQLAPGSSGTSLDGHREPIPSASSNQPAGHVLCRRQPRAAVDRVGWIPEHAAHHHPDRRPGHGRSRRPLRRLVVPAHHRAGTRADRGDPGRGQRRPGPGYRSRPPTNWAG